MARDFADVFKSASVFLSKEKDRLKKYKGGMPLGFFAAIAAWESNGRMGSVGDASLGEVGYYQIAESTPGKFGLAAELRNEPEGNIFLAGLEYTYEAIRLQQDFPGYFNDLRDLWKTARLVFAIGSGGTRGLLTRAIQSGVVQKGNVYAGLVKYVNAGGAQAAGTQSAAKVKERVNVVEMLWQVGQKLSADWPLPPFAIPAYRAYKFPAKYAIHLRQPPQQSSLLFAIAGLFVILYLRRNR